MQQAIIQKGTDGLLDDVNKPDEKERARQLEIIKKNREAEAKKAVDAYKKKPWQKNFEKAWDLTKEFPKLREELVDAAAIIQKGTDGLLDDVNKPDEKERARQLEIIKKNREAEAKKAVDAYKKKPWQKNFEKAWDLTKEFPKLREELVDAAAIIQKGTDGLLDDVNKPDEKERARQLEIIKKNREAEAKKAVDAYKKKPWQKNFEKAWDLTKEFPKLREELVDAAAIIQKGTDGLLDDVNKPDEKERARQLEIIKKNREAEAKKAVDAYKKKPWQKNFEKAWDLTKEFPKLREELVDAAAIIQKGTDGLLDDVNKPDEKERARQLEIIKKNREAEAKKAVDAYKKKPWQKNFEKAWDLTKEFPKLREELVDAAAIIQKGTDGLLDDVNKPDEKERARQLEIIKKNREAEAKKAVDAYKKKPWQKNFEKAWDLTKEFPKLREELVDAAAIIQKGTDGLLDDVNKPDEKERARQLEIIKKNREAEVIYRGVIKAVDKSGKQLNILFDKGSFKRGADVADTLDKELAKLEKEGYKFVKAETDASKDAKSVTVTYLVTKTEVNKPSRPNKPDNTNKPTNQTKTSAVVSPKAKSPNTGDNTGLMELGVIALAGAGIAVARRKSKIDS
ncbi:hypothetical protein ACGCUP_07145 [Eubacteriales bacterium KG125]